MSSGFRIDQLAAACDGFSGSEIEQAIVSALYGCFVEHTELTTEDVLRELSATRPLSRVAAEKIAALRRWAEGRTVRAN